MKKARADSLFAKLAAVDPSLELREWVFFAALEEGKSLEDIGGELHDKGVITSMTAIGKMIEVHGLRYRLDRSKEIAREVDKWEPDKKQGPLEAQLRKNLKKRLYDATFRQLTVMEMVAIQRALTAETVATAGLYTIQLRGAEFVGEVMRDEAKARALRDMASDSTMTPAQYIEAVRHRMYGDAAAPVPGKEGA